MKKAAYPLIVLRNDYLRERTRHMKQGTAEGHNLSIGSRDILTDILRRGAEQMLAAAIENEVCEYIGRYEHLHDGQGHRLVVRNGRLPARTIQTGIGDVQIHQPRVHDKRIDEDGQRMRFSSKILPAYLRRTRSVEELIPWLYLMDGFPATGMDSLRLRGCEHPLLQQFCPPIKCFVVQLIDEIERPRLFEWEKHGSRTNTGRNTKIAGRLQA
jgi:hypothetical protein